MAVKAGMDPFQALQAITINPAKHIGLEDRVGSLEEGNDADIVVTDGCPFEVATEVRYVLIDGNVVKGMTGEIFCFEYDSPVGRLRLTQKGGSLAACL